MTICPIAPAMPAVLLSLMDNSLGLIEEKISSFDKEKIEFFQKVAQGKEKPSVAGKEVFQYLKEAVLIQQSD